MAAHTAYVASISTEPPLRIDPRAERLLLSGGGEKVPEAVALLKRLSADKGLPPGADDWLTATLVAHGMWLRCGRKVWLPDVAVVERLARMDCRLPTAAISGVIRLPYPAMSELYSTEEGRFHDIFLHGWYFWTRPDETKVVTLPCVSYGEDERVAPTGVLNIIDQDVVDRLHTGDESAAGMTFRVLLNLIEAVAHEEDVVVTRQRRAGLVDRLRGKPSGPAEALHRVSLRLRPDRLAVQRTRVEPGGGGPKELVSGDCPAEGASEGAPSEGAPSSKPKALHDVREHRATWWVSAVSLRMDDEVVGDVKTRTGWLYAVKRPRAGHVRGSGSAKGREARVREQD